LLAVAKNTLTGFHAGSLSQSPNGVQCRTGRQTARGRAIFQTVTHPSFTMHQGLSARRIAVAAVLAAAFTVGFSLCRVESASAACGDYLARSVSSSDSARHHSDGKILQSGAQTSDAPNPLPCRGSSCRNNPSPFVPSAPVPPTVERLEWCLLQAVGHELACDSRRRLTTAFVQCSEGCCIRIERPPETLRDAASSDAVRL
jgi:hypothetical protein